MRITFWVWRTRNSRKDLDARRNYYKILPESDKFNLRDYGLGLLALSEGNLGEASAETVGRGSRNA